MRSEVSNDVLNNFIEHMNSANHRDPLDNLFSSGDIDAGVFVFQGINVWHYVLNSSVILLPGILLIVFYLFQKFRIYTTLDRELTH